MYEFLIEISKNQNYFKAIITVSEEFNLTVEEAVKVINDFGIKFRKTGSDICVYRIEIVNKLAEKYTNREIADLLDISITVIRHDRTINKEKNVRVKSFLKRQEYSVKIQELLNKDYTRTTISKLLGISESQIYKIITEFNLNYNRCKKRSRLADLIRILSEQGKTANEIAIELNIPKETVYSTLNRYNIPYTKEIDRLDYYDIIILIKEGYTDEDLAKEFAVSVSTIRNFCRKNEICIPTAHQRRCMKLKTDIMNGTVNGKSLREISQYYGISRTACTKILQSDVYA